MLQSNKVFKILISLLYAITFLIFLVLYNSTLGFSWAYIILLTCLLLTGVLEHIQKT